MKVKMIAAVAALLSVMHAMPASAVDLGEKAKYGKITGDFRLREEIFDRDTKPETANGTTARLRLGYMTPVYEGWSAYLEGETIQYITNDNFDDGQNGKSPRYPAINDPRDAALNQLYLSYAVPAKKDNSVVVGRQVLSFDNQRFIGRANWRQNDTTHDAVRLSFSPLEKLVLEYAYSLNAHRSLGTRQTLGEYKGNMNMLHATYGLRDDLKTAAYSYSLDFDNYVRSGAAASTQLSSRTHGARIDWKPKAAANTITPFASADAAFQTNMGENTNRFSEWYGRYELGGEYNGYTASATFEQLGGNGHAAVQTPLASNHSFNGWAEKFSTKPNDGLRDYFITAKAPIPLPWKEQKLTSEVQLHQFNASNNNRDYGREIDAGLNYTPAEGHTIALHGGKYYANDYSDDATKIYLFYEVKF